MALKWGILSSARINRHFLPAASASREAEVVAVASRDGAAVGAYAAEHAIPRAHADYDALLADPQVEAVYVPLPNSLHVQWSERALRAGKHVLCEKPLSRRPAEVEALHDVAEQAGLVLSEAFMYRHHPQTETLLELVAGGAIGRLRLISASFSFPLPPGAENIRLRRDLDGGALMDVGCYCVHAARQLAGEPLHVAAEQTLGGDGVDVVFGAVMRFADDVLAHFDCGMALAPRHHLEVVGESGALHVRDPWHCRQPGIVLREADGSERAVEVPAADPYRLQLERFARAVAGQAPPLPGRADAVGQARALEALHRAADQATA